MVVNIKEVFRRMRRAVFIFFAGFEDELLCVNL